MSIKKIISALSLLLFLVPHAEAQRSDGKRIISQGPYITHELYFFGMKECIVGASIYDEQVPKNIPRTGKVFVPDKEAIAKLNPDFIFGFVPYTKASSCSVLETNKKLPIVYLDGDLFLQPAPTLLEGLQELKSKEDEY